MRATIDKLIAGLVTIIIISTPWKACNAESNRSGRWELAASFMSLGGQSENAGSGITAEEDDWLFYGINVGTNVDENLNLNTEFVFASVDVDVKGLPAGSSVSGDQNTFLWLVNLDYNILNEPLTPYVTGGVGWGFSDATVEWVGPGTAGSVSDTVSGFAYTLGVGARWDITENIFAKVSYRILWDDEGDDRDGIGFSIGLLF